MPKIPWTNLPEALHDHLFERLREREITADGQFAVSRSLILPSVPNWIILSDITMAEPIKISLRYDGPEVDNGEMDIDDVAEALKGFSGAYGKVASHYSPELSHQIRIAAIEPGSFRVLITALGIVSSAGQPQALMESVTNAAQFIFRVITYVISLKKHTKGESYDISVKGRDNTVNVINADKMELHVPLEAFDVFKDKLIDGDLNRIVDPLRPKQIEAAELKQEGGDGLQAIIRSEERDYFRSSSALNKTEGEFIGSLVSLNKDTNRGTFKFNDGRTCRYHYTGKEEERFRRIFAPKGPVRATAIVEFDENLTPVSMDITSVVPLQRSLYQGESDLFPRNT